MIFFFITLIYLIYASYTDIKTRTVADWWTLAFALLGSGGHLLMGSFDTLTGGALAFVFSYFLYKIGMWAAGDVFLFTTLGFLLPTSPAFASLLPLGPYFNQYPIYQFLIFINSILIMVPYLVVYLSIRLIRSGYSLKQFRRLPYKALYSTFLLLSCSIIASVFGQPLFTIPLLILFSVFKPKQILLLPIFLSLILYPVETAMAGVAQYLFILLIYVSFRILALYRKLLVKRIPISKIKEGMIPAESMYLYRGKVIKDTRSMIEIASFRSSPKGMQILNSLNANGLEKENITLLRKLVKSNKIEKYMLIKESAPMVPSFLVGVLFTVLVGNLFWWVI
jgi:preflagellin peptidase FlaK